MHVVPSVAAAVREKHVHGGRRVALQPRRAADLLVQRAAHARVRAARARAARVRADLAERKSRIHGPIHVLAAGDRGNQRFGFRARKPHLGAAGADARFARIWHERADMADRGAVQIEFVELVLGEIGDFHFRRAAYHAGHGLQASANELREGGFTVAVRAEEADAVIIRDDKREFRENGGVAITDRGVFHRDDGRGQGAFGRREIERQNVEIDERGDRLHFLEPLHARLRLFGF